MRFLRSWKFIVIVVSVIAVVCISIYFISAIKANKETASTVVTQKNLKETEIFDITRQKIEALKAMEEQESEEEVSIENFDEEEIKTENLDTKSVQANAPAVKSNNPYYIKINISANVVTVYSKDSDGNFTVPVKAMVCSTGTATPRSGRYQTGYRARWIRLFGGVHGQYSTKIVGNILFHSVPYLRYGDPASLEYWEYDKLGTSCSMGCVRLCVADAKWVYDNIVSGTIVEFYSSSDPGPLGKPSSQKISSNAEKRDWDPTDPDQNNPWRNRVTETVMTISPSPNNTPSASPSTSPSTSNSSSTTTHTQPPVTPSSTPNVNASPTNSSSPVVKPSNSPSPSPSSSSAPTPAPTPTLAPAPTSADENNLIN